MAPDRGRSERDDPRACNPLTRRVAAEVVKRTGHTVNAAASIENEKDVVVCDKQAVFKLKEEQRQKWLQKALKQAGQGIVTPGEVYDVVSSTRFAEDLSPKVGSKMSNMLKDGLKLFTAKQQKFIMEKATLVTRYMTDMPSMDDTPVSIAKPKKEKKEKKEKKDKDGKESGDVEDMMARIRGFVRDKQAERGGKDKKGGGRRSRSRSGSRSRSRKKGKDRKRSASHSSRDKDRDKGRRGRGRSRSQSAKRSRSRSDKKNKDSRRSGKADKESKSKSRSRPKKTDSKRKRSRSKSSDSHRKDNKGRPAKRGRVSASKSRSPCERGSPTPQRGNNDKKAEDKKEKSEEKKEAPSDEKKDSKTDEKKRQRERSSASSRS